MKALIFFPFKYWIGFVVAYFFKKLGFQKPFEDYDHWLYSRKKMMPWLSDAKFSNTTITVQDPHSATRFLLRKVSSDIKVFEQVILNKEYEPVIAHCRTLGFTPRSILDLGANIGLTTVYLSHEYPNAFVVAVEPDPKNASILYQNMVLNKLVDRVRVVKGAVWGREVFLQTKRGFRDSEGWSVQVEEASSMASALKGYTVEQLMQHSGFDHIDLLKIDIEGAESQLFDNEESTSFLNKVSVLCIEVHEEACPVGRVTKWLDEYGFGYFESGEHLIAHKKDIGKE